MSFFTAERQELVHARQFLDKLLECLAGEVASDLHVADQPDPLPEKSTDN